jgi:peptide/nickel transport system substrate-binding protein
MLTRTAMAALLVLPISAARAQGQLPAPTQTLNIALDADSDLLDPTVARTYVSRIIFGGLCDKLFDIDENLRIVPQLALSFVQETPTSLVLHLRPGVVFHDGTALDAQAVAYNFNRHLTFPGSTRRAEISTVDKVDIIDSLTVRIMLKTPSASFVSQLTDRAGMMVSPKAAEAAGADFGLAPVCTGPFRFVERVAQDRVVLDRFPGYWDAGRIHFARVVYRPIPDSGIRLANLQAGTITIGQGLSASDVDGVKADKRLRAMVYPGLGYGAITFNIANGPRSQTPFGQSALIRKAFELSLDRDTLNNVVFNGLNPPVAQGMSPSNPLYNNALPPPKRDLAKARALLAQAGAKLPVQFTLTVVKSPDQLQVGEVIQAMAAEAGFNVRVEAAEFASALAAETRGDFQATAIGWSGRVDPDGNLYNGLYSSGPLNASHYSSKEVDIWLDEARLTSDPDARRSLYARITNRVAEDMPGVYLYNTAMIMGMQASLTGFRPVPDGLIRLQGMKLGE